MKKEHIYEIACTVIILFLFPIYNSCNENDENPEPIQLLQNSDMELGNIGNSGPQYWNNYVWPGGGIFDFLWSDDVYFSPTRSLMISSTVSYDSIGGIWEQILNYGIPHNKNIKLTVKIKAESLEGNGAGIGIRADNSTQQEVLKFESTEDVIDIKGTFNWKEYNIEMDSVPDATNEIHIFLMYFPKTTGTVYFDNAELTYNTQ
jgi:hypothetical protein